MGHQQCSYTEAERILRCKVTHSFPITPNPSPLFLFFYALKALTPLLHAISLICVGYVPPFCGQSAHTELLREAGRFSYVGGGIVPLPDVAPAELMVTVLEGEIVFTVVDRPLTLSAGQFMLVGAGVAHSVEAKADSKLMLTKIKP